jgi:type I restriction enzyme S subunit
MISNLSIQGKFPIKKLSEVAEFLDSRRRPITASDRVSGPYPYYGANGQQDSVDGYIFDEPLILLAEDGGLFDQPDRGIAYAIEGKTWVNNHAHVIRPKTNANLRYLLRVLENYDVTPWITGSTRAKLTKAGASGIQIPLPPLAEQKRIAAILDAADALRAKRREALAQLDALLQSTFLTLFGDPASNPMGWPKPPLLELCSAKQWPTISGPQLEKSGYPVYGANGQIGYYSKYNHEHPTVLVTCRGATCGTINICPPKCYVTGNAMALDDPDPKRITLNYLEWVLRIRGMNDVICGAAQPQITRTGMAPITIPLPPLPLQQKFAAIVESIERQKTTQRAHLAELDALFAALQHRAFRGEL